MTYYLKVKKKNKHYGKYVEINHVEYSDES